jgi:hypothetical protein
LENLICLKFVYCEKATKFSKISTLLLSVCTADKSKVEISQNVVAFSEYTNFKIEEADIDFSEGEIETDCLVHAHSVIEIE